MEVRPLTRRSSPTTALLVHGWDDDPTQGWLGWLQDRLQALGYVVIAPKLTSQPAQPGVWSRQLQQAAAQLDQNSIIVAHSLGCWLTMRLLETLPLQQAYRAGYFVAGFAQAPNPAAEAYFTPPPDWRHVRAMLHRRVCLVSLTDTVVKPARSYSLAASLQAEVIRFPDRGHFLGADMKDFPELLELIQADLETDS